MVETAWSSAISPSGDVSKRLVKPLPGPAVEVVTILAPKSRSTGLVVVAEPLLLAGAAARVRCCHIHRAIGIRTTVFKDANIRVGRSCRKRHGNGIGSSSSGRDVLGIVDGLRQRAS